MLAPSRYTYVNILQMQCIYIFIPLHVHIYIHIWYLRCPFVDSTGMIRAGCRKKKEAVVLRRLRRKPKKPWTQRKNGWSKRGNKSCLPQTSSKCQIIKSLNRKWWFEFAPFVRHGLTFLNNNNYIYMQCICKYAKFLANIPWTCSKLLHYYAEKCRDDLHWCDVIALSYLFHSFWAQGWQRRRRKNQCSPPVCSFRSYRWQFVGLHCHFGVGVKWIVF